MLRFDGQLSTVVEQDGPAPAPSRAPDVPLAPDVLDRRHRYWQAANYLTVGQIYLQANPLLREPLLLNTSSPACWAIGGHPLD